jgi:hypothetical protein
MKMCFYDKEPQFCTQDAPMEMVEKSPNPMDQDQEAGGGGSDVHSGSGAQHNGKHIHSAGRNNNPTN